MTKRRKTRLITLLAVFVLTISAVAPVEAQEGSTASGENCVSCHTDQDILQSLARDRDAQSNKDSGECCSARLPPLEPWKKVLVGDAQFLESIHNLAGCTNCHGGVDGEMSMIASHNGLNPNPSDDPHSACGQCHDNDLKKVDQGLHTTLAGLRSTLEQRGADFDNPAMQTAFDRHCATCHSSCGQCHVSRPQVTDGGFLGGHEVKEYPPIKETCLACHGARIGDEFTGQNEGVAGSVHWLEGHMVCYDCHGLDEIHGTETAPTQRYDASPAPGCIDCHPEAVPDQSDILDHDLHWNVVACTVCHVSGSYKNCFGCHVGTDESGLAYLTTDESQMLFKIGRNPIKSAERPWEYVLVRHVPVEPDTFKNYGDALLPNFDNQPTWKYTTPHNIQRVTPQNENCDNCHGNAELYLMAADVRPARWEANIDVMITIVPEVTDVERALTDTGDCAENVQESTHVVPNACNPKLCIGCHPGTPEGDWTLANENIHTLYALVDPAGDTILCQDCHSPEGSFDWVAEGYSPEEISALVWTEFPDITPHGQPTSGPNWLVGVGLVLAAVVAAPFVAQRNGGGARRNNHE